MVREYKGSHSGEHGDGLVRSEFHEPMFGSRLVRAFEEVKDTFRPGRAVQSRQDRPAAEDGRPHAVPLQAGLPADAARHRARLVGMGLVRQRRRDVQQQRRLPQIRPRRDVSVVPRDRRRATFDARPRQHAAPGAVGPARPRRAGVGRDARHAGAVRLVQGLQARMPDRRRHGAHEDRVPVPLQEKARPVARATARSPICRAMRRMPRGSRRFTKLRNRMPALAALDEQVLGFSARRQLPEWSRAVSRREPPPASSPPASGGRQGGACGDAEPAKSCCWSIRSTAISSRKTRAPPSGC